MDGRGAAGAGGSGATATGGGVLTEDASVCGSICRDDVATLVVKALFSDKADNKTLTLSGAAAFTVTGLIANLDAAGTTGAVTATTANNIQAPVNRVLFPAAGFPATSYWSSTALRTNGNTAPTTACG